MSGWCTAEQTGSHRIRNSYSCRAVSPLDSAWIGRNSGALWRSNIQRSDSVWKTSLASSNVPPAWRHTPHGPRGSHETPVMSRPRLLTSLLRQRPLTWRNVTSSENGPLTESGGDWANWMTHFADWEKSYRAHTERQKKWMSLEWLRSISRKWAWC